MEHELVLSFISCSVGGKRTNLFIRGLLGRVVGFPLPGVTGGRVALAGDNAGHL